MGIHIVKLFWLLVCALAFCSAQNPDIKHLKMKVKRLNRITNVLQQDVDDIWTTLSSTARNKHRVFTNTTENDNEMESNIMLQVNETIIRMKQQKSEIEQFVLYARKGLLEQKMLHHKTVRDLTKNWLEFQKNTSAEIKEMRENLNILLKENTMCHLKIENVTHECNEKIHKIEDKTNADQEKIEGLEKNLNKLEEINALSQLKTEYITHEYNVKIYELYNFTYTNKYNIEELVESYSELQRQLNEKENMMTKIQQGIEDLFAYLGMSVCQEGWERFEHHCYLFSSQRQTWNEALSFCQARNSYLVELQSDDEIQFVGTLITKKNLWIGASDNEIEGTFIWNNSREPVSDSFWNSGEPNNKKGNEHCVHAYYLRSLRGKFNDNDCSDRLYFACEKLATFD